MEPTRLTKNAKLALVRCPSDSKLKQLRFSTRLSISWEIFANRSKCLQLVSLMLFAWLFGFCAVFAYAPETTHKGLTDEAIDFFNVAYPNLAFSKEEKEFVKKGSVDEDENTQLRWMRHFYDPIYKRGLTFEAEEGTILSRWQSSKNWAQDTAAQAEIDPQNRTLLGSALRYFDADTDYSWDRGIYEYAWGNKQYGLEALGHILHLIQDSTVPDHTRNDPHPPFLELGSPYEHWTEQFNEQNMRIAEKAINAGEKSVIHSSLSDFFEEAASYSNSNFFSKDTIFDRQYKSPLSNYGKEEILSDGGRYIFEYRNDKRGSYRLVARFAPIIWLDTISTKSDFFIDDVDHLILTDYWARLSKHAVLDGAGVIKLFFDEVEKEREQKKLLAKQEQSGGILARILDGGKTVLNILAGLLSNEESDNESGNLLGSQVQRSQDLPPFMQGDDIQHSMLNKNNEHAQKFTLQDYLDYFRDYFEKRKNSNIQLSLENAIMAQALGIQRELSNIQAQFVDLLARQGGRQEDGDADEAELGAKNIKPLVSDDDQNENTRPSGTNNQATPWYNISQGGAGGQSPLDPSQVSPTSSPPAPPPSAHPDITPPNFSFSIKECDEKSVSSDGCVVAPQLLNLSWSSTAIDLDVYNITCSVGGASCGGFSASPTATSTTYMVADQQIYTFQGFAKDKTNNTSAITTITVEVFEHPVVINEIAWRGTSANNPFDEWLELKNNTSKPIDLSQWALYSETDLGPYLSFANAMNKIIPANGYYLIERTDDTTISTLTGDFVASFGSGLGNSPGETLTLVKVSGGATTTMDRVPTCSNNWCGGSNSAYDTMERVDPLIAGDVASNWGMNNGIIMREKDAQGATVFGTPKARNSLHYLIDAGSELSVNKTLTKTNSPYLITDTFTVPSGKILTIKEGVVIKFAKNTSALEVSGSLQAKGTSGEEVVFTTLSDDTYGGDTDNVNNTPAIGLWRHVKILSSAINTSFNYVRMRYGGKITSGDSTSGRALLRVESALVTITNSAFEYSAYYGIRMTNSNSTIATSTFSNMNPITDTEGTHAALFVSGGNPLVSGNTFSTNKRGVYLSGNTQAVVKANTLTDQTDYPIQQSNAAAVFSGNSGSGNAINMIQLSNALGVANATTTLVANPLPFILSSVVTVPQTSALAIEKNVVVKGSNNSSLIVSGNLLLKGATSSDIVFEASDTGAPDGYWAGITLEAASKATLRGFTLRSAGGSITGGSSNKAGLRAKIPVIIENALIEKNRNVGIWADEPSTIRNTVFRKHTQGTASPQALFINNIGVTLDTVTFSGNTTGIYASGGQAIATSTGPVIFEGNTANTTPADLL